MAKQKLSPRCNTKYNRKKERTNENTTRIIMMRMQTMESCPSAVVSSGRASMRVTRRLLLLISTLGGIRNSNSNSHRIVAVVAGDTVLDEQFCQVYYTLDDNNLRTCDTVRSQVRAERRGNGTPTLELGNKETQPYVP